MKNNPLFFAKVLLFGEYGIIEQGKSLTLPFNSYKGSLKFSKNNLDVEQQSHNALVGFTKYLENLQSSTKYAINLDLLKKDLTKGMFFDSDIPQGYGVGSSGALVAAIFDKYSTTPVSPSTIKKGELKHLKTFFGEMESFFHGKSSGIDPLICFMNIPLLIKENSEVDTLSDITETANGQGAIFLINSGQPGETEPMVEIFFEKLKQDGFRNTLKKEFIKYNNACIDAFLKRDVPPLFRNLKKLSAWALNHFKPMIPTSLLDAWQKGIDTNTYYLKLCGSGGGGYILGFTKDYIKTEELLKNFDKEVIYKF